jgi:predicted amidohydrolase
VYVAIGVNERAGGTLYNTLLYFTPDAALAGRHRKLMPTGVASARRASMSPPAACPADGIPGKAVAAILNPPPGDPRRQR